MTLCCLVGQAQEVLVSSTEDVSEEAPAVGDVDTYSAGVMRQYAPLPPSLHFEPWTATNDSLHLPALTNDGRMMPLGYYPMSPFGWGSFGTWRLHEGLNFSLGASVFAQFGRNAHHGAGFGQSISAMYAMPITDKLSFAVGGYLNNVYWHRDASREAGLTAVMGYKFNDHWEAYLYGQKTLTNSRNIPYPLYDMGWMGDRIGAAVRYNINPSISIHVSMEHGVNPNRDNFHDTYMRQPVQQPIK